MRFLSTALLLSFALSMNFWAVDVSRVKNNPFSPSKTSLVTLDVCAGGGSSIAPTSIDAICESGPQAIVRHATENLFVQPLSASAEQFIEPPDNPPEP